MKELIKDPIFNPEDHISIGITYKDWCIVLRGKTSIIQGY